MKIKQIGIKNFKGISSMEITPKENLTVFTGKNGSGKSSVLEAINYGLTGNYPSKSIRDGETEMEVYMDVDSFNFSRIQTEGKANKFKYNGKNTTAKIISEELSDLSGVSDKAMKVVTSSEVVKNMSSSEFGDFIMSYIPEDLTLADILKYFPNEFKEMAQEDLEYAKDYFSTLIAIDAEPYSIQNVKNFYQSVFDKRKELKKSVSEQTAVIESLPNVAPSKTLSEIEKELEEIIRKEGAFLENKNALANYERIVNSRKNQEKQLEQLQQQINNLNVSQPDDNYIQTVTRDKEQIDMNVSSIEKIIYSSNKTLELLKKNLENISKPYCLAFEKIKCNMDKTPFIEEINKSIAETNENIEQQSTLLSDLKKQSEEKKNVLSSLQEQKVQYEKKILLQNQYNKLKETLIEIPPKPEELPISDLAILKETLTKEKQLAEKYQTRKEKEVQLENTAYEYKIVSFLVKILEPKGCVMEKVVHQYLSIFNDTCNKRAKLLSPNMEIKFIGEDGIKIYCKPNIEKPFIPFENLSGGEKTCVLFLIMDMLNVLTDLRILLFDGDEISKLDEKVTFDFLKLLVNSNLREEYDHIFINMIDNKETMSYLKNVNVDLIQL